PLACSVGSALVIVHCRQGVLAVYQRIAPVRALIWPPALLTDRDRYLYLTWAEPTDSARAALNITTSRGSLDGRKTARYHTTACWPASVLQVAATSCWDDGSERPGIWLR